MTVKNEDRMCYFVPIDAFVPGRGWRASVVLEGQQGHFPTGNWPYSGGIEESLPYFWGNPDDPNDYDSAQDVCDAMNRRMGLSKSDVNSIVASSMFGDRRGDR